MAACQFETKSITRVIPKLHRVSWTIENVSLCFGEGEIKGPEIFFSETCICYMTFRMFNLVEIILYNSSNEDLRIKEIKSVLLNSDGAKLDESDVFPGMFSHTLEKHSYFSFSVFNERLKSLKEDKLIIHWYLKVIGSVKTESVSLKLKKESKKQLFNDVKAMFNNPSCSDFKLQVEEKFIHAHKNVLSFRSEYFKKMFQTQTKENALSYADVTDVPYPSMKKLVEFLYTGDVTMTEEDDTTQGILNLYIAADKYQVLDLKSLCANKLIFTATIDNILEILKLAERHCDEKLKIEAMQFLSFHLEKVVKVNDWKTFMVTEVDLASEILNFCLDQ